jgi:hypothetical protein
MCVTVFPRLNARVLVDLYGCASVCMRVHACACVCVGMRPFPVARAWLGGATASIPTPEPLPRFLLPFCLSWPAAALVAGSVRVWQSVGDTGPGSLVAADDCEIDDVHTRPIVSLAAFVSDDTQFSAVGTSSAPTWVSDPAGAPAEAGASAGSSSRTCTCARARGVSGWRALYLCMCVSGCRARAVCA